MCKHRWRGEDKPKELFPSSSFLWQLPCAHLERMNYGGTLPCLVGGWPQGFAASTQPMFPWDHPSLGYSHPRFPLRASGWLQRQPKSCSLRMATGTSPATGVPLMSPSHPCVAGSHRGRARRLEGVPEPADLRGEPPEVHGGLPQGTTSLGAASCWSPESGCWVAGDPRIQKFLLFWKLGRRGPKTRIGVL